MIITKIVDMDHYTDVVDFFLSLFFSITCLCIEYFFLPLKSDYHIVVCDYDSNKLDISPIKHASDSLSVLVIFLSYLCLYIENSIVSDSLLKSMLYDDGFSGVLLFFNFTNTPTLVCQMTYIYAMYIISLKST